MHCARVYNTQTSNVLGRHTSDNNSDKLGAKVTLGGEFTRVRVVVLELCCHDALLCT